MPVFNWIDRNKEQPKHTQICLVLHESDHINIMQWDGESFVMWGQLGFERDQFSAVTHWVALSSIGRPYLAKNERGKYVTRG
jgi:hypothetical protein